MKNARWYGEKLVRLLDDKAVATLPRNTESWFFELGENQVWLDGLPRKKYYALHGLAVTMFLLGKEAEAGQYARKANELIIGDDGEIKALLLSDLVRLKG